VRRVPANRFGRTIRRLREERGIGLRELAAAVGISATYLSQVELGDLPPPSSEKVEAVAKALGQDPDQLVALAGRIPSDLAQVIKERPREMALLIRSVRGLRVGAIDKLAAIAATLRD
jgi:HTH-type transcriptional regulator, competence development regulator